MWRACLCFGVVMACSHATGKPTLDNRAAASSLPGAYWCAIEDSGFKYGRFPCAIRKTGDKLVLAKLAGSQRFEGEITPAGSGFAFSGRFYCPFGDCDQALDGLFEPATGGSLRGTFRNAKFAVELTRAPETAFGGASYGGDAYGGDGYGVSPVSNRRRK
jgi:hypothetical protein